MQQCAYRSTGCLNRVVRVVKWGQCTTCRHWTPQQMIAHHTMGGCNLRTGDILGTGTISSPVCFSLQYHSLFVVSCGSPLSSFDNGKNMHFFKPSPQCLPQTELEARPKGADLLESSNKGQSARVWLSHKNGRSWWEWSTKGTRSGTMAELEPEPGSSLTLTTASKDCSLG